MKTKDDMISRLRSSSLYKAALASVDEEQAKRIATYVESWLISASTGLVPIIQQAAGNTAAVPINTLEKADNQKQPVITTDSASGSLGD